MSVGLTINKAVPFSEFDISIGSGGSSSDRGFLVSIAGILQKGELVTYSTALFSVSAVGGLLLYIYGVVCMGCAKRVFKKPLNLQSTLIKRYASTTNTTTTTTNTLFSEMSELGSLKEKGYVSRVCHHPRLLSPSFYDAVSCR